MGRIDAAETLYRQVADADPRNAIAVVGLARVALERGDEAGALDLARRALAIDPENAAAGRMVARLEEVIAYRGETVPRGRVRAAAAEPNRRPSPSRSARRAAGRRTAPSRRAAAPVAAPVPRRRRPRACDAVLARSAAPPQPLTPRAATIEP